MNIICPRCGKDDTIPFSDSEFHTTGFECESCHQDFFVDDGRKIKTYEDNLVAFKYERTYKTGDTNKIEIRKENNQVFLYPYILYKNKMLQPFEKIDITSFYPSFVNLLFKKIYILDWDHILQGLILPQNEEYKLELEFTAQDEKKIDYKGINKFPPYLKVLDDLFLGFFENEH